MAYKAKDGKSFGNRQKQKAYDERQSETETPNHDNDVNDHDGDEASEQPIEDMVAEHGPAEEIHMKHNDESGEHEVTTTHGGKKHHSKHGSRDEAHMHAAKASGLNPEPQQEMQQPMSQDMGIPGM